MCHIISKAEEKSFHCSAYASGNEGEHRDMCILADRATSYLLYYKVLYKCQDCDPLNSLN